MNEDVVIATIAYLAPEIPGPSSTFVYNEIFSLESKQNLKVVPFSVHRPVLMDKALPEVKELASRTHYLYGQSLGKILISNVLFLFKSPVAFVKAFMACLSDVFRSLKSPKLSVGICYRFMMGIILAKQLKDKQVSHLHIHFAHVPTDIGMYASLASGIPFSVTSHANDIFERGWLIKQKVNRSAFFATISEFNIRWLKRYGVNVNKLKVIRCGVDSSLFTPRATKPKDTLVIFGFLGRLVEKKGAKVLVDACRVLLRQGVEHFRVELVGGGPLDSELKQQVRDLGLSEYVKFIGALPHPEIAPWLSRLDYFVLPCVKDTQGDMDGIPVALMEAMLTGVSVISTDVSGIPELVISNETGLVTKTSDAEHLCLIMKKAINETEEVVLSRNAKAIDLVRLEYDLHNNAKRLAGLMIRQITQNEG